jgi:hypothetical protein
MRDSTLDTDPDHVAQRVRIHNHERGTAVANIARIPPDVHVLS